MKTATKRPTLASRRGASSLTNLFITLAVLIAIVLIYMFVPPYWNAWKLGNMLKSIATKSEKYGSEEAIKLQAIKELAEYDYQFTPEEISVRRDGRNITITADYNVPIYIPLTNVGLNVHFKKTGSTKL